MKVPAAAFFFGLIAVSQPAVVLAAIDSQEFLASDGAAAFKAGRFSEALLGFQALLDKFPGDTTVLRYIAITYDRVERYDDAIATFRKALAIEPKSAALRYFLGVTLFKLRRTRQAADEFRAVVELAEESLYAKQARQYIEAINQQRSQDEPAGGIKRWDLAAALGFQWDDNIAAAPERGSGLFPSARGGGGFRGVEQFSAGYKFVHSGPWSARAGLSGYLSQHGAERFRKLDLSTFQPGVEISYVTALAGRPLSPSLRYDFNAALLNGRAYSHSHIVTAKADANFAEDWIASPFYRFAADDFREEGFNRRFSSRDAANHSGGAALYYFFWQRRANARAGYEYHRNEARGDNFDFTGHKGSAGLTLPLFADINLDIDAAVTVDRYNRFRGTKGDRRTTGQIYSASLSRGFWNVLFLTASYQHTIDNSNYADLEYRRNIAGLTVAVKY